MQTVLDNLRQEWADTLADAAIVGDPETNAAAVLIGMALGLL